MNKRQAIKEVRALADDTIDQLERLAKGWDKDDVRSDAPRHWEQSPGFYVPSIRMDTNSHDAMVIAREWN